MNYQRLLYFIKLAKTGNFTKAAAELNITQPALSKQISLFEEELNTKLLSRNTKTFKLTFAGEILVKEGEELVRMNDEILHHLKIAGSVESFPLNIGISTTSVNKFLNAIISNYRKENPDIIINLNRLDSVSTCQKVRSGSFMIGIIRVEDLSALENLQYRILSTSSLGLVCKKTHRFAKKDLIKISEIKDEPIVLMRTLHGKKDEHEDFIRVCERHSIRPNIINECDLIETLFFTVNTMDYITFVAADLEDTLPDGLIMKPIDESPRFYTVAIWQKSSISIPYIKSFIDAITT